MTCIYDRTTNTHLVDGEPCTHDQHGVPVNHCRTRRRCTSHLAHDQHVCPRCTGKIRHNLGQVVDLLTLMPAVALEQGRVDSEALNLAGPHADYVTTSWAQINAHQAGHETDELDAIADPYTCLTMHERNVREHLNHDTTTLVSATVADAASYLEWALPDLSRTNDGALLARYLLADTTQLRSRLGLTAALLPVPTRGAPCPECQPTPGNPAPRLVRWWAPHWQTAGLKQPDALDAWRCPNNTNHIWTHAAYERWITDRTTTPRKDTA